MQTAKQVELTSKDQLFGFVVAHLTGAAADPGPWYTLYT